MEKNILERFRDTVKSHRDALLDLLNVNSTSKRVCLAECNVDDVTKVIQKHNTVLEKIDYGEFGKCTVCGEEVGIDHLELDFTTQVCLECYSDTQLKGLERDLELAAKVQKQLLPQEIPIVPGFQIAAHTEPAHIVTGDYFDFYSHTDNSQGIAVADVMGKGLPASILMSKLQAFLRVLGPEQKELHSLSSRLNELFRYNLTLIRFISLILLKLNPQKKLLSYCNAGHNPGIWWDSKKNNLHLLNPTGPALGLSHTAEFTSRNIQLNYGDLIVAYTDGIIEARNENNEEFGLDRLIWFVKLNKSKSAKEFLSDFRKSFKDFAKFIHDDITMLVLKVT
jgi:sigma-B regulation protein RsbU (phosphoserine phosphatase)